MEDSREPYQARVHWRAETLWEQLHCEVPFFCGVLTVFGGPNDVREFCRRPQSPRMIQMVPVDSRMTQMDPMDSKMLQRALFESRGQANALQGRLALEGFGRF